MFAPPKHLRKNVGRRVWADPFVLGNQQARKGQHEAAVQQFSRLIDRGVRQDAAVFASRGSSAQALGDHVRAVYDYSMAIRLQPDEPSHYTSRAISLVALHQLETMPGALHDHDKAVALVTGSGAAAALVTPATVAGVYLARGLARETAGRYAESVDDLCHVLGALGAPRGEGDKYDASTTLLASAAEVTGALLRRGMCLRRLGRYDLSLRDLRDVVERSPELAMAHEQLGLCLRERDDESATPPDAEAAEAALATAVRLRPSDANLRVEHARALGALGRLEPAADALAEALQMAPSEPSVSLTYADHLRHVAAEATVPYKQPLAYDAAAGAYALAERVAGLRRDAALERVERLQAAAAKARRAGQPLSLIAQADLADASATAKAMAGLAAAAAHGGGQCYAAQQLWPDAHARYSAALKLCPDKAESRLELATTLYAQGAPRQALVELDVCVTMRPSWAAPRRLRGELHREGGALRLALADFTAALEARDPGPEAPATARRRGAAVSPGDDYVRRGGVSMLLGDPAAALDDFEAAAKAGVPAGVVTVRLQTARAAALRALGRRRRALRLLGIALRHGAEHIVSPYEPTPQEMEERSKPKPKRGITLLLCERAEAAVADLSSALEHKAGWAYAHYARGFAHKACDDLDRAAADFEASRRANGGLRVDYDVVFHVQAGLEMLFDEAGWDPLPSVLTMMSTEDARREEEEPEVPEEEGEEGAEEELEEATAPPTGDDEAYLVDSSAAPPTWHPPPTEWRGRGRVRDVATAEEDEEDEEDQ